MDKNNSKSTERRMMSSSWLLHDTVSGCNDDQQTRDRLLPRVSTAFSCYIGNERISYCCRLHLVASCSWSQSQCPHDHYSNTCCSALVGQSSTMGRPLEFGEDFGDWRKKKSMFHSSTSRSIVPT